MTRPVVLRLPWFTLYGMPDRPGAVARARCVGAMLVHETVELVAGTGAAHSMSAAVRYRIGLPPTVIVPASQRNKLYVTTVDHGFPNISSALVDSRSGVELRVYASGTVDSSYESIVNAGALVEVRLSNSYTGEWEPVGSVLTSLQVVSGDVTIATLESVITGFLPADTLLLLGYPSLVSVSPQVVAGPYPGGTVTGGSGPGIYRFDGTNLTFEGTPELGRFYVASPTVFDEAGAVGVAGNLGALLSIDFDGPGGDDPIEIFVSVGVASAAVAYDNTTSGLTASNVQAALDELAAASGVVLSDLDPAAPAVLADPGVSDEVSRADHVHPEQNIPIPLSDDDPVALGVAAPGVSDEVSRADHVHEAPTGAEVSIDSTGYTGPAVGVTNAQELAVAVDAIVASSGGGLQAVRAATTANITLSGAQTIDGVSVIAGDDVLVKNQSTTAQNGVYTAAAGAWSLASWDGADVTMIVREGTTNGGLIYTNATNIAKLTTGLPASSIVSGTLDAARLPPHDTSLLTSGTLEQDRIAWGGGLVGFSPPPSTNFPSAGGYFPLSETMPYTLGTGVIVNQSSSIVSGRLQLFGITLLKGQVINSIAFFSGTTALSAGTNQWFGLWSDAYQCLAVTTNDTSTAWAANSFKVLPLAASATYTVPATVKAYLGIVVTATTVPTLRGTAILSTTVRGRGLVADTSLTTPVSVGSYATPTAMHTLMAYAWAGGAS